MMRVDRFGMKGLLLPLLLAASASLAGCGGPQKDPNVGDDSSLLKDDQHDPPPAAAAELAEAQKLIDAGKFAEAKEHVDKASAIDPKSGQVLFAKAVVAEGLGDAAAAEASYKAALAADPGMVNAAQNLSAIYLGEPARPDEAIKMLNDVLAKAPGDIGLRQNLAYAYSLKKDVESASKQYDMILSTKGGDTPQIRIAFAGVLLDAKLNERAAEQLKKVLAVTEDDVGKLVTVGRLLQIAGAHGDCVSAFGRAIKIKADEPGLFTRRGMCRQELKDEAGAKADFEAALKIDPKFAPAQKMLDELKKKK